MKSILKLFPFVILVFVMTSTKSLASISPPYTNIMETNNPIAQVSSSQDANNNYVMTFSLRQGKSWTQNQFVTQCDRWMTTMTSTGPLLTCSLDTNTQTITAVFNGITMAAGPDAAYMNSFFKKFGYQGGYNIL